MGAFLDTPKTEKTGSSGCGNGLRYGLSSMQGWRIEMEDAHQASSKLPGNLSQWSFFAVFDGHAGARVSEYCANNLLNTIVSTIELNSSKPSSEGVKKGIYDGFLKLDEVMRSLPEMKFGEDKSGSTAVSVLISPNEIFFANCGDSRAIFVRSNSVSFATQDHKPVNPGEKERIQNAGGSVMIQRVNGSLAVSRSLGDFDYKNVEGKGPTEQLVSAEPEIDIIDRDSGKDEFLVLACDGIWDVMSNDELAAYVHYQLTIHDDLERICNDVIDTCFYKGSKDNMSIVIVCFDGAPKVVDKVKAQDNQLDEEIKKHINEFCSANPDTDLNQTYNSLSTLNFSNLPPGGGLAAKYTKIEELWKEAQRSLGRDVSIS